MKTLKDLTPEIREKIPFEKERCTKNLYSGAERENFDEKKAVEYIEYVYNISGRPKPFILFADHPTHYQQLFRKLSNEKAKDIYNRIFNLKNSGNANGIKDTVHQAIQQIEQLEENKNVKVTSGWLNEIGSYSRAFFMWYKFISREFNIQLSTKQKELDYLYENSLNGIIRGFTGDKVVIMLKVPWGISMVDSQLHNLHESALKYSDQERFYIKGVKIPNEIFKAVHNHKFTFEDLTRIKNEDVKSAVIVMMQELHGDTYVGTFLSNSLNEVDVYVDKKEEKYLEGTSGGVNVGVYRLMEMFLNGDTVKYVNCYCPTTDRMFFLGVEPKYTDAKNAIASLYRVPKKLKKHIRYIQRQGERFSTVFDEVGTAMLKNGDLTQQDIADTTTVTGDFYFSNMRYEY